MANDGFKLLRVDLTSGRIKEETLDSSLTREQIGGVGIATRLVFDEVAPNADALGPDNKLAVAVGPLTGTGFPGSASVALATLSPLTGTLIDGAISGFFGPALRATGYDGIIVQGASAKPVALVINGGRAELKDAGAFWGKDARATVDDIPKAMGASDGRAIAIGPAGEKRVLLANLVADLGRNTGRGGMGAVMGTKKLKAIVVAGGKKADVGQEAVFKGLVQRASRRIAADHWLQLLQRWGTAVRTAPGWRKRR